MKKLQITNIWRKSLQWIILLLLAYMVIRLWTDPNYIADFEAYCPFGGLMAFSSFIVNNSLACSMNESQIFMGVVLFAGILLFSKLFCSYICPIGTLTEWLGKIGEKFNVHIVLKGLADRLFRMLKYALLFVTFYFTVDSSELFCKKFDPYYALFSGFDNDVYLWYAIPAIIITILGSIFIRQFWCKYLCPLSALSNIFTNAVMFIGVLVIYFVLLAAGLEISWVWPALVIAVLGYVLESVRLKGWITPAFKITRDENQCTDCGSCDLICPMKLNISKNNKVEHIDCHLCGECIEECPEKNVLQINKRNIKWLPASATVLLIALGLYLATTVELPTINIRWGSDQQFETAAVFSKSGLKSIKCFGSASSFASSMKRVDGVLGVEAYVKSHTAVVYYDSTKLKDDDITKAIFSSAKTLLRRPPAELENLSIVQMGIDKLFDSYDNFYLTQLMKQTEGIYGFTTEFGEPVLTKVFYDASVVSPEKMKEVIEQPTVTYVSRKKSYTKDIQFKVEFINDSISVLSVPDFKVLMFTPFDRPFNEYKKFQAEELSIYKVSMPQAANPAFRRSMSLLMSHLSSDDAVVRFRTVFEEKPYAYIYFVTDSADTDSIYSALVNPQLTVHYSSGKTGQVKNPFKFKQAGKVISLQEAVKMD